MSQQPQYVVYQPPPRPPSNGLGVAGFVMSLVGLISCGILSPIGLLFSLIALFKSPRGLAVAGVIIGFIGTIGAIIGLVFGAIASLAAVAGIGVGVQYAAAGRGMEKLGAIVETNIAASGSVPADWASVPGVDSRALNDPWGHQFHLIRKDDKGFDITCDGPDGVAGTFDDFSLREFQEVGGHRRRVKRSVHID